MAIKDNLQQKIETARKAGYSDSQIQTFLKSNGINTTITPSKDTSVANDTTESIISSPSSVLKEIATSVTGEEMEIPRARVTGKETSVPVVLGKYAVNIPLSAVDAAYAPTKQVIMNTIESAKALYDIAKTSPTAGSALKSTLEGFKDTLSNIYTKTGESIYNYLEKKALETTPEGQQRSALGVSGEIGKDVAEGVSKSVVEDPFWWIAGAVESPAIMGATRRGIAGVEGAIKGGATGAEKLAVETAGKITKPIKEVAKGAETTLFGEPLKTTNIDDVVKKADEALTTSAAREIAETASSKPSLIEKWVGISPDIKNRIAGKGELLKEYFDVAHIRNNFDTAPTVMEHATKYTDDAVAKMESVLNETGSEIGSFRKKIGTYEANIDQVKAIEKSFNDELGKLNLEVKNGQIIQKPGTVKRVGSDNDIKVLNEIYGEFSTVKENPSLEKLIDLRNIFDRKINFAKTAREVSNSLDPLSRNVRSTIASRSAQIVGTTQAENLKAYSEFMDAFSDLKSFTDRRAGGEYLLRLVLSGRGGEARRLIQTIKQYTGVDLMDHAVMSTLTTDLIGNEAQKNLFRQEISKAGLDAYAAITGDPKGILNLINDVVKKNVLDVENVYLKAAGGK